MGGNNKLFEKVDNFDYKQKFKKLFESVTEQLTSNCIIELYDSGNRKKTIKRKPLCKFYEIFDAKQNIYAHTLGVAKNKRKVIKKGTLSWPTISRQNGYHQINDIIKRIFMNTLCIIHRL